VGGLLGGLDIDDRDRVVGKSRRTNVGKNTRVFDRPLT
jgi:hypothetical protein